VPPVPAQSNDPIVLSITPSTPGFEPPAQVSGMAVASLVTSFFIPILGVVFGFIARSAIRKSAGRFSGAGLALAGLIIGWVGIGLTILIIILASIAGATNANRTYSSVESLKDAYVSAGGGCGDWTEDDVVASALESGNCGSSGVLMIFSTRSEALATANAISETLASFDISHPILVGPNWVLNVEDAELVQPVLGGDLVQ
jgi:hypothetical protein